MSALAVFLTLDGRPAPSEDLQRLLTAQQSSGPDSQRSVMSGPCALGVAVLTTMPEDHLDPPCAHEPLMGVTVVFDGFLANRADLAQQLDISYSELSVCSDARLIARAYERWRVDAFTRAEGEFAAALWDAPERRLILARDVFGLRPLYYCWHGPELYAASELQAIARLAPSSLNERVVGEALVGRHSTFDETLFTDIKRLPPAHLLVVEWGRCDLRRYWSLDLDETLELPDEEAYAARFRAVFSQAVGAALRSDRPTAVMLSGGLDSSTIVAEAAQQRNPRSPVLSFTIGHADPAVDETKWARAVADRAGVSWHVVTPTAVEYDYLEDARQSMQLPPFPSGASSWGLRQAATSLGARVLLNGVGGDEWFYGSNWRYADLISQGRLVNWMQEAWADRALGPVTARNLVRDSVFPLLPSHWRQRAASIVRRKGAEPLVREDFAQRISLHARTNDTASHAGVMHARRDIAREAMSPGAVAAIEEGVRIATRAGMTDRHPYFNRRVAEFAMSIPETERRTRGIPKRVVRRAYRSALPPAVVDRVEYFDYSFIVVDTVKQLLATGVLAKPQTVANGWIGGDALSRLIAQATARDAEAATRASLSLWNVVAVETWLAAVLG